MDKKPETDDGYVTLVNAKMENDVLVEVSEHTGIWAWKHPHDDGTVTYTELKGHVDFDYVPEKKVLHDITLYAKPGQKIAFVGATGAGKTTITNLINRFYDFVIAHRLSTVQNSDVIIVLDHGRMIECGDHNKLISEKGTYYQLYTGAFESE